MNRFEGQEDDGERGAGAATSQHRLYLKVVEHRIRNLVALANRLDRIEEGATPVCADYYQALVRNLMQALSRDLPQRTVRALLNTHPGAAELYENMHYATAGLSRAPPDGAMTSRTLAVLWLARVAVHTTARVRTP